MVFLTPTAPDYRLDWDAYQHFDWIQVMKETPQEPDYHAEGNVWIHTRMVCEALLAQPEWRALPRKEQELTFAAALLHDVAKAETTAVVDGKIRSHGHSTKGAQRARRILWDMGASLEFREGVSWLVRHHQQPFFAIDKQNPERFIVKLSLTTHLDHLTRLAFADNAGRISVSQEETRLNIQMFEAMVKELDVGKWPYPFTTPNARYTFCKKDTDYSYIPHDDFSCNVVMLAGLPGSGKDTYISKHYPQLPVVSLDDIRRLNKLTHADDQSQVVRLGKEGARELLRQRKNFVYNATNLTKQHRREWIDLFTDYKALVTVRFLDVERKTLFERNRAREHKVPEGVIERMIDRMEPPDATEAHVVEWILPERP